MGGFNRIDTTANRIKEAMESAGKRQADVSRETGIDKGSLSHYLKGKYEPKQDVIYKLAKALNVSEMWLWGYDCERERRVISQEIKDSPVKTGELHVAMAMDADLNELYEDFKHLDARERQIVKELARSLRKTKSEA